jgi:hypothetical protein
MQHRECQREKDRIDAQQAQAALATKDAEIAELAKEIPYGEATQICGETSWDGKYRSETHPLFP